jgi:Flp pilus assembly pilin Flp
MASSFHGRNNFVPPALRRMVASIARLLADEEAQAVTEYAVVAAAFGVLMFVFLAVIRTGTGTNLNNTQTNLTALYKASPAP